MGRLIRNMLRQSNALTNTPPRRGPERAPMLATAAQMPIARARFLASGKVVRNRASEFGTSRAAPSPWKARAHGMRNEKVRSLVSSILALCCGLPLLFVMPKQSGLLSWVESGQIFPAHLGRFPHHNGTSPRLCLKRTVTAGNKTAARSHTGANS